MTGSAEEREIRLDRMRYVKNTASSRLCYLAIVFDVLYFVKIYQSDVGSWYYQILVGGSIIYNLLFMLVTFLASEGVKNYKAGYSKVLYILGVLQAGRIFVLPVSAHNTLVKVGSEQLQAMDDAKFIFAVICLALSAVCLIAAAEINRRKCSALAQHAVSPDTVKEAA
ncbi:MAG: hypothetical protein MJ142_05155 [Clostridia bacterium]|nr:hypothetical protein [Clostridia bacterium]